MSQLAAALAVLAGALVLRWGDPWIGWPLLLGAAVWAARAGTVPTGEQRIVTAPILRGELVAIGLLTAAALALRTVALDTLPPGCWFDEAENGLETLRLLSGDLFVFTSHNNGRGALQFFWTAPFFALLGATPWALRFAIAAVGTLTIPAAWLLFRRLAGGGWGLFGAALLTASSWHLHVSRVAFDVAFTPFFDILAIHAALIAGSLGALPWFAATGALAAAANYAYQASRITPLIVAPFISLRPASGGPRPGGTRGPAVAAAAFAVCLLPLVAYAVVEPGPFVYRSRQVNVFKAALEERSPAPIARSLTATLRMFHERGDANPRQNDPGRPMLDPVTGTLFVLGLVWGRRIAGPGLFYAALSWVALPLLFGGVLTVMAPHANRTSAAIPAVCLFATWGARGLLGGLRLSRTGTSVAAALIAIGVAGFGVTSYFVSYPASPGLREAFSAAATDVGEYVLTLPPRTAVTVTTDFNRSVVLFVSGRGEAEVRSVEPSEFATATAAPGVVIVPDAAIFETTLSGVPHVVQRRTGRLGTRFDVVECGAPPPRPVEKPS